MSATYDRLAAAHPDRVGKNGRWADLDGYEIAVWRWGHETHSWDLRTANRFIVAGSADTVDAAWRAGCDALDAEQALTAQLTDIDESS